MFQVGDVMKIKDDLIVNKTYGSQMFVDDMDRMRGKNVTIKKVLKSGEYFIEEYSWIWTNEMFEEFFQPKKQKAIIKDFVYAATKQYFTEVNRTTGEGKSDYFRIPERKSKIIISDNAVICILDDGTKGVAKCTPDDEFNETKGIKIAYNRAKIKLLQKELNKLIK